MSPLLIGLSAFGVAIIAFLGWRITSVARGARQRDAKIQKLLDPLAQKLSNREPVSAEEVRHLCEKPQLRPFLYELLQESERLELFPERFLSRPNRERPSCRTG